MYKLAAILAESQPGDNTNVNADEESKFDTVTRQIPPQ